MVGELCKRLLTPPKAKPSIPFLQRIRVLIPIFYSSYFWNRTSHKFIRWSGYQKEQNRKVHYSA